MRMSKKQIVKRCIAGFISLLVIAIIAGTLWGSFYLIDFSLTPSMKPESRTEAFNNLCDKYPYMRSWLDSLNSKRAIKDTTIVNEDGVGLHAFYIRAARNTNHTAVIVHGYTDRAINMFMIGYLYSHDLGFNILLPDLQHQGESGGKAIQMGWKDRLDVMQWMNVANYLFGGNTAMVVHGISMGAATTMMVSGEEQPQYMRCYVEDCGYTSVWDEFEYELKSKFGLPSFPLLYIANWICQQKYGWSFNEASCLEQVKKGTLPMFFIHGDNDTYVPTWMVVPLYNAKLGPKEIWTVKGATHAQSYKDNREEYTRRVRQFIQKNID